MPIYPPRLRSSQLNLIVAAVIVAVLIIAGVAFFSVQGTAGVMDGGNTGAEAVGDAPAGPEVDNRPAAFISGAPQVEQATPGPLSDLGAPPTITWEDLIASLNVPNAGNAANHEQIINTAATVSPGEPITIVEALGLNGTAGAVDRPAQLQAALLSAGPTLTVLHDAVAGNPAMTDQLAAAGYSPLDVVALGQASGSGVLVYVQPPVPSSQ